MSSDQDRKELARKKFSNPVFSDPSTNLSFHGFKRRCSGRSFSGSCRISKGFLIPLAGGKRKNRDSLESLDSINKVIKLSDFGKVMKSRFSVTFRKHDRKGEEVNQAELDSFLTYLMHHSEELKETTNFLTFYVERQVLQCH